MLRHPCTTSFLIFGITATAVAVVIQYNVKKYQSEREYVYDPQQLKKVVVDRGDAYRWSIIGSVLGGVVFCMLVGNYLLCRAHKFIWIGSICQCLCKRKEKTPPANSNRPSDHSRAHSVPRRITDDAAPKDPVSQNDVPYSLEHQVHDNLYQAERHHLPTNQVDHTNVEMPPVEHLNIETQLALSTQQRQYDMEAQTAHQGHREEVDQYGRTAAYYEQFRLQSPVKLSLEIIEKNIRVQSLPQPPMPPPPGEYFEQFRLQTGGQ